MASLMNGNLIKGLVFSGVSLLALSTPVQAQDSTSDGGVNEIIVEARRKGESIQDAPLVVNAITPDTIEKLNIRDFKEIQSLTPGLQLSSSANGIGVQASMRGVAYDVNASGNNGTIEFYLNDAPISAGLLFQTMYDVGQIEVLRGPQGTLRGRASPSGSITVTTRRPDLSDVGGYAQGTVNNIGGWNVNGAINVPIIADKLAVRVAGALEENEDLRVRSIHNPTKPEARNQSGRVSVLFQPIEALTLFGSYMRTGRKVTTFDQVESLNIADPDAPASSTLIRATDRRAAMYAFRPYTQDFQVFNWQAEFRFAGQKLNYVGSHNKQRYTSIERLDRGGYFGDGSPLSIQEHGLITSTRGKQTNHELRLSSDERVFGMFDYVIGAVHNKLDSPSWLTNQTPLLIPTPAGTMYNIIPTPIVRGSGQTEKSVFGSVTAYLGQGTEVTGGLRHINYKSTGYLTVDGQDVDAAQEDRKLSATIYSASLKHRFNDDLMAYASFGTSWRAGSSTNPTMLRDSVHPDESVTSLYFPASERSKSYEIGFKSSWLDKQLTLNVTGFHQTFKNYAYSARNIWYVAVDKDGVERPTLARPALAAGVPVKVTGVEGELNFRPSSQFNMGATVSYAKSKIRNGVIPCNDYIDPDGIPDATSQVPTVDQILKATNQHQIATCRVNYRASALPPFSATINGEFSQPLNDNLSGYIRGLVNYYGKSQNDPENQIDTIKAYATVNLFAGLRDPDGGWELGAYAKNVFNVERVLSRDATALGATYYQVGASGAVGMVGSSTYRAITMTPPREIGVQLRVAFGSR